MVAQMRQEEHPAWRYHDLACEVSRTVCAVGVVGVAVFLLLEKTGALALIAQYALGVRH